MLARSLQTNGKHIDFSVNASFIYGALSVTLHQYCFLCQISFPLWSLFASGLVTHFSSWEYVSSFNPAIFRCCFFFSFSFFFIKAPVSSIFPHLTKVEGPECELK